MGREKKIKNTIPWRKNNSVHIVKQNIRGKERKQTY